MSKKVQTHGMELEKIGPYTLFHLAHYTMSWKTVQNGLHFGLLSSTYTT